METKNPLFWWVKNANNKPEKEENANNLSIPKLDLEISSSLAEFLEKEQNILSSNREDRTDVDVGSIIEEMHRLAAQSPLGPYHTSSEERSVDDIMKEAERIYLESSKSFEQLSQRSKTSQNITDLNSKHSKNSTPTPKSVSPLPNDDSESVTYSEDFSEDDSKSQPILSSPENAAVQLDEIVQPEYLNGPKTVSDDIGNVNNNLNIDEYLEKISIQEELIKTLEQDNKQLREDVRVVKVSVSTIYLFIFYSTLIYRYM